MQKYNLTTNNKRVEIPDPWKNRFLQAFLMLSVSTLAVGLYMHFSSSHPTEEELIITTPSPSNVSKDAEEVLSASISASPAASNAKIFVDVSGAVSKSGVYELPSDARLTTALEAAGGLAKNADSTWVAKNLNLATKLTDGDKIYIPQKGEIKVQQSILQSQLQNSQHTANTAETTSPQVAGITSGAIGITSNHTTHPKTATPPLVATAKPANDKISVNTASASELDTLPGVGEVTAQKIIDNRPYTKLEELKEKKAVNKSTYDKIINQIEL